MKVALDESGNSGQNLLIAHEPVLVLASVSFDDSHLSMAEEHFARVNAVEWKFSQFKRNQHKLDLFMKFAKLEWVNGDSVRLYVTNKRFFAVTKLVDLIYEPLARQYGHDLYERGEALAIANLLAITLPVCLGEVGYIAFLSTFVDLVRNPSDQTAEAFYKEAVKAHKAYEAIGDQFNLLDSALIGASDPDHWLTHTSETELDPLVPCYFSTIDFWGQKLQSDFFVVSDESKVLRKHLETIRQLSDPSIVPRRLPSVGGGYAEFPYRSVNVSGVCSTSDRSVQIADLFAGAANSTFGAMANQLPLEAWQLEFMELCRAKELLLGAYWASTEVTAEGLGAEHVTGEKIVDFVEAALRASDRELDKDL